MSKYLDQAIKFFGCKENEVRYFDVEDTFNDNKLEGYICHISDYRYGALYIHQINGMPCEPQIVWSSPKIPYPFNKLGVFLWPRCIYVLAYEKIDGTNIVAYKYKTKKKTFVTYKTRFTPIARSGKFGDFENMWRRMLKKYPNIPEIVLSSDYNLSFEMYGTENKHLIIYDVPLDMRLLFGIGRASPEIVSPDVLNCVGIPILASTRITGNTKETYMKGIKGDKGITGFYKQLQAKEEAGNKHTDMGVVGSEGYVFYCFLEDGTFKLFKCKPHDIEKIHWAYGGIGSNIIRATIINAYENTDDVTYDFVKKLLLEEFEQEIISKVSDKIRRIMDDVRKEMKLRDEVLSIYDSLHLNVDEDKVAVMRIMSKHFDKKDIRYVYWAIKNCRGRKYES